MTQVIVTEAMVAETVVAEAVVIEVVEEVVGGDSDTAIVPRFVFG